MIDHIPYQINYKLIAFLFVVVTWPFVFIFLIIRDFLKGNKFRPFYRAAWPFIMLMEVILIMSQ